jgi:hypothetical protein
VAGGGILTRRDSLFMLLTVQPEIEDFRLELSVFSSQHSASIFGFILIPLNGNR